MTQDYADLKLPVYRLDDGRECKEVRRKVGILNERSAELSLVIFESNKQLWVPTLDLTPKR